MEFVQVRNQKIAADGVAGADVELPETETLALHQLRLPMADQLDGGLHML